VPCCLLLLSLLPRLCARNKVEGYILWGLTLTGQNLDQFICSDPRDQVVEIHGAQISGVHSSRVCGKSMKVSSLKRLKTSTSFCSSLFLVYSCLRVVLRVVCSVVAAVQFVLKRLATLPGFAWQGVCSVLRCFIFVGLQRVQAPHAVLHQRRHWMQVTSALGRWVDVKNFWPSVVKWKLFSYSWPNIFMQTNKLESVLSSFCIE